MIDSCRNNIWFILQLLPFFNRMPSVLSIEEIDFVFQALSGNIELLNSQGTIENLQKNREPEFCERKLKVKQDYHCPTMHCGIKLWPLF